MKSYSGWRIAREALRGNRGWEPAWRKAKPKKSYSVIIVGGGGHGLATAYYLAKEFGIRDIAVVEKSVIGTGNVARNTTIVRSDYWTQAEAPFYKFSVDLWKNLSQTLNYNLMFSERGTMSLFHSDSQRYAALRQANAMRLNGVPAEILSREELLQRVPLLSGAPSRYPILGAMLQPDAGTARHDAVVWGYARAASALGVDIIEHCEVTGIVRDASGCALGVESNHGRIHADKLGLCVAGHSSRVAALADLTLPIESHCLQAFVTEAYKPVLDTVVMFGIGHFYVSQSDKGGLVFGGHLDGYNSYAQRGNLPMVEDTAEAAMLFMPALGRARLLRHWGGVVDMSMDGAPIIAPTSVENLYFNGGWCYGGFKAIPASGWCFAHTLATGRPHSLNAPFNFERFARGDTVDAYGSGPVPHQQ